MTLDDAGYVSIAELVVYIPCLIVAIYICSRHGFRKSTGWVYTLILCVARIVGAICQLVTYTSPSTGLYQAVFIIDSIGISPLLFATLGVIRRILDVIESQGRTLVPQRILRLVYLLILIALIIGIVGGSTTTPSASGSVEPSATAKAGSLLYVGAFGVLTLIYSRSVSCWSLLPGAERRSPFAVAFAWPFILVRLLYSILVVFLHDNHFSLVNGSVAVRAAMSVAEEMVVVITYLALAFTLPKFEPMKEEELPRLREESRQWNRNGYE